MTHLAYGLHFPTYVSHLLMNHPFRLSKPVTHFIFYFLDAC
jgi:hypothetical protein